MAAGAGMRAGACRAVAGRAGRYASLDRLPYSISSSAPAMTLGGIEFGERLNSTHCGHQLSLKACRTNNQV
jgi:hypothetical protein